MNSFRACLRSVAALDSLDGVAWKRAQGEPSEGVSNGYVEFGSTEHAFRRPRIVEANAATLLKHALMRLLAIGAAFALTACASKPILIPNDKYQRVGETRSEHDVDRCMDFADAQLKKTRGRRIMKAAVTGAVIGGAVGGISGSTGHIGTIGGAAAGATGGAAAGAAIGYFATPEDARRSLVTYCLNKKGYAVAGWDN